jgi:hypothetical protein
MFGRLMNGKEFGRKRQWANRVLIRGSPEGAKENPRKVRIAGVPDEIRTEHLPNRSLVRSRYTNIMGIYK